MVGVNPFGMADDLQAIITDDTNWDFVWPYLNRPGPIPMQSFLHVENLMPPSIAAILRLVCETHEWKAVGLDGFADKPVEQIGNYRLSNYNQGLADVLWRRLRLYLPEVRTMDERTPTDHEGHSRWKPVGVSPLFRFIRYKEGGQLVAHYDATYKESDTRRTLMSMVIYLTSNQRGATRFLKDAQAGKPMSEMNFADWDRAGNDDEVILRCEPHVGSAIIFDHRMLHDGEPLGEGDPEKIIIRTDIMFEKV